jgi:hypothetical protein
MLITVAWGAFAQIDISPPSWNFGTLEPGTIVEQEVLFTNNAGKRVVIDVITTCDCVTVNREQLTLNPGESSTVRVFFDSEGEYGEEEKLLIIKADVEGFERKFYSITGTVLGGEEMAVEPTTEPGLDDGKPVVDMDYYYSPSCAQCRKFINSTIPELEKKLNIHINLNKKDIYDPEMYEEYIPRLSKLGEKERAIPILFLGNKVLQGGKEIDEKLEGEITAYLKNRGNDTPGATDTPGDTDLSDKMAILPAISAGLLDGINPCAFATLISLLTALALAGKRKNEILILGIFFTLSVFTTYFLVGLGVFKAIQAASSFGIVAIIIHWVLVGVLVVFAGLSLYDYYLIKVGRTKEMILQLPDSFKKRIQKTIKTRIRSATIVLSSISLGFLVSLFELGCTGQVYFPFITVYVLKIEQEAFGYILLLIYNLGFILPLVAVFGVTYSGISSKKITKLFQKHMSIVKLLLAVLFIALAIYMILSK